MENRYLEQHTRANIFSFYQKYYFVLHFEHLKQVLNKFILHTEHVPIEKNKTIVWYEHFTS